VVFCCRLTIYYRASIGTSSHANEAAIDDATEAEEKYNTAKPVGGITIVP